MQAHVDFDLFFQGAARTYLERGIDLALDEDGRDATSEGIFGPNDILAAEIVAKAEGIIAGLPIAPLVLNRCAGPGAYTYRPTVRDGDKVSGSSQAPVLLAEIQGPSAALLKAERVILNFLTHLSGVATLTRRYVDALAGSRTRLLDTRKTLPGLRHAEKYAVRMGGGWNHRMDLEEMCMLKDNHIDRAGSITKAVATLRAALSPCPPIEVECRTLADVDEAVACRVDRIMLDNMLGPARPDPDETLDKGGESRLEAALARIPKTIETEISGGVNLETLGRVAAAGPDFVSVGRLTHSAPVLDCSMRIRST